MLQYNQINSTRILWCQTDSIHTPFHEGKWNLPPGVIPPGYSEIPNIPTRLPYQAVRCVGEVGLLRVRDANAVGNEGIFQCTILDKHGKQHSLYVGVYSGVYNNYSECLHVQAAAFEYYLLFVY